jgi:hypothetical protein
MDILNLVMFAGIAVLGGLYVIRRKARLKNESE